MLRLKLDVLELFLDCMTKPNERLVEFGIGGKCNSCAEPKNAAIITQSGGIPLIIQCLSSPVRNTVMYALGSLYCSSNASNIEEILKPEVIDLIKKYAAAGDVKSTSAIWLMHSWRSTSQETNEIGNGYCHG